MKYKSWLLIIALIFLSGCSYLERSEDYVDKTESTFVDNQHEGAASDFDASGDEQIEDFIGYILQNFPDFELLDYVYGAEGNAPIRFVGIAKDNTTGSSSTLFIWDERGMGQVVLASDHLAKFRKEEGLALDNNVILVSLDVTISDEDLEIHDFEVTVTQKETETQGVYKTVYSNKETIRSSMD